MLDHPVSRRMSFHRWSSAGVFAADDEVVEEVPLALVYNGIAHAVMLGTPADLEDFAVGFTLTEGIVEQLSEIYGIEVEPRGQGIELRVEIANRRLHALKAGKRALAGRTGCGLCGIETLAQATRAPRSVSGGPVVTPEGLASACAQLVQAQELHAATGASHAAAFALPSGQLTLVREDVGRHNALDKLIGALLRSGREPASGFALLTCRASVEMITKAAAADIGVVAALSAPTGLAIRMAEHAGITLIGFADRQGRWIYSRADRVGSAVTTENTSLKAQAMKNKATAIGTGYGCPLLLCSGR